MNYQSIHQNENSKRFWIFNTGDNKILNMWANPLKITCDMDVMKIKNKVKLQKKYKINFGGLFIDFII